MDQNSTSFSPNDVSDEKSSVINTVLTEGTGKLVKMSSKIPKSISYRRDPNKFLTPTREIGEELLKTPSNENCSNKKVMNSGDKFKHVTSKVCTHWSPEEKQRNGLKTFFERKEKHPNYGISLSPEIMRHVSRVKANRRSLPAQITLDPIGSAIDSIKRTPIYSYSSCSSSSNSSFVSLPETSTEQ